MRKYLGRSLQGLRKTPGKVGTDDRRGRCASVGGGAGRRWLQAADGQRCASGPVQRYRQRPWLELVELWVGLNRQVAAVMEAVPDDKLQTLCTIGDHEAASFEWWMRDYVRHLRHHLEQLGHE